MINFNIIDLNSYPSLLREIAEDVEQCLASGDKEKLLGRLVGTFLVIRHHIGPLIETLKKEVEKERGGK